MKRFYIYKMIHLPSGRVYIGQRKVPKGVTPENDSYHGSGKIWKRIYNKHSDECIKVIIDYADTKDEIDELERKYIKHYKEVYDELCVNIAPGGYNLRGYKHTDDYKKALSEKMKGENNPFYGRRHSEETKRNISESKKGVPNLKARGTHLSEERKKHLSEINRGENHPQYGTKHTDEWRSHMSKIMTGRHHTEETRRKMSDAKRGVKRGPRSEETKQKISQNNIGKKRSEETRRKMSESAKGKIVSPETREKLRLKTLQYWARKKGLA